MKLLMRVLFVLCLVGTLFFATWYVRHNDIYFSADVARDFFLLQEVSQKHIVLIGPRSSVLGLFHGPLWTYLNFPAYLISHGNPVAQGWYWVILLIGFAVLWYITARKLFGEFAASLFVLMTTLYTIYHVNGLFNPHGVFFLLPIFFFAFVRYTQTLKISFLLLCIFLLGCMIQFQMAIGIPFFILSVFYLLIFCIKQKKKTHLLFLPLIIIPLGTFIAFDVRHEFSLFHFALRQLHQSDTHASWWSLIVNRFQAMVFGMEFLRYGIANGSFYAFLVFSGFLVLNIWKNKKYRSIYLLFIYFFVGFFVVSLLNRYNLLYFYIFPIFPLVFLIFSSFITGPLKYVFLGFFLLIYVTNIQGIIAYAQSSSTYIGKHHTSWKMYEQVAQTVFNQPDREFGYFVYAPDVVAYEPRYAMEYMKSLHPEKTAHIFEKRPVTYLVIAPPPSNNPYMQDSWWTRNELHISAKPTNVITFPSGYKIERYELSGEDLTTPFDPNTNPGLHFR